MSGFRCRNSCGYGLNVPHFAQHNDVRCLAQGRAQCPRKAGRVSGNLTLAYDALLVRMQVLNRVFDRNNVAAPGGVDLVNQARQRGTFTAAGRSGYQDHAAAEFRKAQDDIRNIALPGIRNTKGHNAACHRQRAALAVGVAAEPTQVTHGKGEIIVPHILQRSFFTMRQFVRTVHQDFNVIRQGSFFRDRNHLSADLGHDLGTGYNKHV